MHFNLWTMLKMGGLKERVRCWVLIPSDCLATPLSGTYE